MWHRLVDAVRALFGGPKAHQEAYERAIAAASAIDRNNELASRVEFETLEAKLHSLLDGLLQVAELDIPSSGAAQPIRSPRGQGAVDTSSPKFKRWFGDWEAGSFATMPRRAVTLDEAKNKAGDFVGNPLNNRSTGLIGTVSKTNLAKMTQQKAGDKSISMRDHALAVANIDHLFSVALLDDSHSDRKGEPTIRAIHRFVAPMIWQGGAVLAVKLTVKETTGPKEPNPIYTVEAMEIENPPSVLTRANPDVTGIRPQAGFNDNVRRLLDDVKGGDVSKVVDAEGKPLRVQAGTQRRLLSRRPSKSNPPSATPASTATPRAASSRPARRATTSASRPSPAPGLHRPRRRRDRRQRPCKAVRPKITPHGTAWSTPSWMTLRPD